MQKVFSITATLMGAVVAAGTVVGFLHKHDAATVLEGLVVYIGVGTAIAISGLAIAFVVGGLGLYRTTTSRMEAIAGGVLLLLVGAVILLVPKGIEIFGWLGVGWGALVALDASFHAIREHGSEPCPTCYRFGVSVFAVQQFCGDAPNEPDGPELRQAVVA